MKSYKGWSSAERTASDRETKKAIAAGEIEEATTCERCGQNKGIIMYHNHDYSHPTKFIESMCWRCHMIHHSIRRNPTACAEYWESIIRGVEYEPVYKHDFGILRREHDIQ